MPIVHNLEQDGTAKFHFVQGTYEVPAPRGYPEFFGPPPHYSFYHEAPVEVYERTGITQDEKQIGDTPEKTMRNIFPYDKFKIGEGFQQDLDRFNTILNSEDPFEAILGFSHDACIAATLLEDNIRKVEPVRSQACSRWASFFVGCPLTT